MLEQLVAFLLPIAAASGWFAAAKHYQNKQKNDGTDRLNRTYLRSIDFLLAEKPEKAIDAFVDILEEDRDTVETHIALGNLFRRKGEMERAISIHQGLMGKPALNAEHRARVLFELGMDYMRAGLFDRAEKAFTGLTQ
ncbi:MAG TPA: lipopolysaccharide assembly protein LapB, partial [Armatimonadetes bacterium]|nr:lipopolysaccharide assembly protein LapB [Armatimonadota bacterium]